jgi:hypothetical protein
MAEKYKSGFRMLKALADGREPDDVVDAECRLLAGEGAQYESVRQVVYPRVATNLALSTRYVLGAVDQLGMRDDEGDKVSLVDFLSTLESDMVLGWSVEDALKDVQPEGETPDP